MRGRTRDALGVSLAASRRRAARAQRETLGTGNGVEEVRRRQLEDARACRPTLRRSRRSPRRRGYIRRSTSRLCLPATLIERAARAVPASRSAGRTSTTRTRARIPAAFRRACCSTPARRLTIVGHSERREAQRESDADVQAKAEAALAARARRHPVRRRKRSRARGRAGGRRPSPPSSTLRCRAVDGARPSSPSPMSRSGRSAPARSRRSTTSARCTRRCAQRLVARLWRCGRAGAHPLRRLGQGVERGRNLRGRRCRRRAGRRREPQGRRLPADRRRRGARLKAARIDRLDRRDPILQESLAMFAFLLIVQSLVALSLVGVILMQRSEGGGLGVGGSSSGFMTARGAADFLTRSTVDPRRDCSSSCRSSWRRSPASTRQPAKIDTSLANTAAPRQPQPAHRLQRRRQPAAPAQNQQRPAVPLAQ